MTARRVLACGLALALAGGCMTIYPDPELPDVIVEWMPDEACTDDVTTVRIEVRDDDSAQPPITLDVPCADGIGRVEDVARTRHVVQAALLDGAQAIVARSIPFEVDLRNGASQRERVFWFYRDEGLFTIAWRFAGGETCASLSITALTLNSYPDDTTLGQVGFGVTCEVGELDYYPSLAPGTYSFQMVAATGLGNQVVATSTLLTGQVIHDRGELTDLGTIELTRCSPCETEPPPPPPP